MVCQIFLFYCLTQHLKCLSLNILMTKYVFIILLLLCFAQCKNKKEKIELNHTEELSVEPVLEYTNTQLNPAVFFNITLELNKIISKYQNIINESTNAINSYIQKRETEINKIYEKYKVTEKEFNHYGETHYRELESYLRQHPEIDENLGKNK